MLRSSLALMAFLASRSIKHAFQTNWLVSFAEKPSGSAPKLTFRILFGLRQRFPHIRQSGRRQLKVGQRVDRPAGIIDAELPHLHFWAKSSLRLRLVACRE